MIISNSYKWSYKLIKIKIKKKFIFVLKIKFLNLEIIEYN